MRTKTDYEHLLVLISEENRIWSAYPELQGTQKQIADARLKYISDYKLTFSPYEVACIHEMLKPVVDGKKILQMIEEERLKRKKRKQALEKIQRIIEREDAEKKYKEEEQEAIFIAWFLTALIKQKVFFYDDMSAIILFEALKTLFKPDGPRPSMSI